MRGRRKGVGGSVPVVPSDVGFPDTSHSTCPRAGAGRAGLQRHGGQWDSSLDQLLQRCAGCSSLRVERGPQSPGSGQGHLLQPRGSLWSLGSGTTLWPRVPLEALGSRGPGRAEAQAVAIAREARVTRRAGCCPHGDDTSTWCPSFPASLTPPRPALGESGAPALPPSSGAPHADRVPACAAERCAAGCARLRGHRLRPAEAATDGALTGGRPRGRGSSSGAAVGSRGSAHWASIWDSRSCQRAPTVVAPLSSCRRHLRGSGAHVRTPPAAPAWSARSPWPFPWGMATCWGALHISVLTGVRAPPRGSPAVGASCALPCLGLLPDVRFLLAADFWVFYTSWRKPSPRW